MPRLFWLLQCSLDIDTEGGLDVSEEASEQESILDKLDCDDQLLSDTSDTYSEIDDVDETEHDSYDSDGFSKDPLSSDVSGYRYDTVSI